MEVKVFIYQLRTNSHHIQCETGWWKSPEEAWEERVCTFCKSGQWNPKNISFWNVMRSKTSEKVMRIC